MTYEPKRPKMAEVLRPGKVGSAEVDHFVITPDTWQGFGGDRIPPGKYARLRVGGYLYMSDTDFEWRTNSGLVHSARGRVLISGLGIGFTLIPVLLNPEVRSVTVLEKNPNVVTLVEPQLRRHLGVLGVDYSREGQNADRYNKRLEVVVADAYEWRPAQLHPLRYDAIYHDVWGDQSTDCLAEMTKLKRRYARLVAPGGWQRCWREEELRYQKRRERRAGW